MFIFETVTCDSTQSNSSAFITESLPKKDIRNTHICPNWLPFNDFGKTDAESLKNFSSVSLMMIPFIIIVM